MGGQQAPVVLSYQFWTRHYGGDRSVLGRNLEIDHKPYTIVGVMPKDYTWEPDMYVPMSLLPTSDRTVLPIMQLKPGVSLAMADAEIGAMLHQFAKQEPRQWPVNFTVRLEHITDRILAQAGHTLTLLFVSVVMLLVIGCANCAILLLARGMARQGEFAVRTALGASRYRIVRQSLSNRWCWPSADPCSASRSRITWQSSSLACFPMSSCTNSLSASIRRYSRSRLRSL